MRNDVAVVGAGTAGLIVARDLARMQVPVTVYDQKERLGHPAAASGIVSIRGLDSLGIDYRKAITNTLYGADIHAGREVLSVRSERPVAQVLDRQTLNGICHDECVASGGNVVKGKRIDDERIDEMHGRSVIVGADGAVSSVARHFGMGPAGRCVMTYKAEYSAAVEDTGKVEMFFDNGVTPGFFGWTCPKGAGVLEVSVGIGPGRGNSKEAFDRFAGTPYIRSMLKDSRLLSAHASLIPIQGARRIVDEANEVLLVGDAAGQVKASTGGGIVFGGSAAMLAAGAIAAHIRGGSPLGWYEKAYRKGYGLDTRLHGAIRGAYSSLGGAGMGIAIRTFNALGLDAFLSRHGDMDRPSAMLRRLFRIGGRN